MTILIEHLFDYNFLINFIKSQIALFTDLLIMSSLLPLRLCSNVSVLELLVIDMKICPNLYLLEVTGPASPKLLKKCLNCTLILILLPKIQLKLSSHHL